MLLINFDDELKEVLDTLISGLLPHENFDKEYFVDIYENILRYIHADEMPLEYRVLFNLMEDVLKVNSFTNKFEPIITSSFVDNALQVSLIDFIVNDGYKFKSWFETRGVDANFNIPTNIEDAGSVLYREVMSLYERCFNKALPSSQALPYIVNYKNLFMSCASKSLVSAQVEIIQDKFYFDGKYYKGADACLDFVSKSTADIQTRLNDESFSSSESLDSLEKINVLLEKGRALYKPLSKYGIEPIDEKTPILAHRLVVFCARENVGKTLYAIYLACNMLMDDRKVIYMCGESATHVIFNKILCNYIYKKYRKFVTVGQIVGSEPCSEEALRLINIASCELANYGNLVLRKAYTYENFYKELKDDYERYRFDGVFIDHSAALMSTGKLISEKERIDNLSIDARNFKNDYPVFICITSHLSVEANQELSRSGKVVEKSPTRGSTTLSKEADDIYLILTNPELEKQDMRALQVYKRRDGSRNIDVVYLQVLFNSGEWVYDKRKQNGKIENVEVTAAYSQIEEAYLDDFDGEVEIDLYE